jgi:hypothetical protein
VWAGSWRSAINEHRIPGTVITESRRARNLGTHELPTTWVIDDPEAALTVSPDLIAGYQRAVVRVGQAVPLPEIVWDAADDIPLRVARAITELDDADWTNALAVVGHLARVGPGDATMLRQLAIPGVHSKWIEQNAALVCAMLGVPADPSAGDPLTRLIAHIGLHAKQTPLHVTVACPRLRAQAGGLRRFHATIPVLNDTVLCPRTMLIVENDAPGQTLETDLDGVAVIHGLGAGAPILADLNWIHTADRVLYWGDIDRAGLAILASLRRADIPAPSILMDETTLDAHPSSWHTTRTQMTSAEVPAELTATEAALYARLSIYHQTHGRELQLEQEHIPNRLAYNMIRQESSAASS